MKIDPRRVAALQIYVDALAHDAHMAGDPQLIDAFAKVRAALGNTHEILKGRGLYLQVPPDYKPPEGLGGCSGGQKK